MRASTLTRATARLRALCLWVAVVAVFAAGAVPACGEICCPLKSAAANMHAQMPCCEEQASIDRGDAVRLPPGSSASASASLHATVTGAVAAKIAATPPAVAHAQLVHDAVRSEPSPPLFLLHAQFLI